MGKSNHKQEDNFSKVAFEIKRTRNSDLKQSPHYQFQILH